jgi:hypothetical protein
VGFLRACWVQDKGPNEEGLQMTDLLVFCVLPDLTALNMAQVAVTEEGHHLQSFPTNAAALAALEKGITPNLIFLEPVASCDHGPYRNMLRHVPETNLCFLMTPGERLDSPIARTFQRARFLTKPLLRQDIERVLEDMAQSVRAEQDFGTNRSAGSAIPSSGDQRANSSPLSLSSTTSAKTGTSLPFRRR